MNKFQNIIKIFLLLVLGGFIVFFPFKYFAHSAPTFFTQEGDVDPGNGDEDNGEEEFSDEDNDDIPDIHDPDPDGDGEQDKWIGGDSDKDTDDDGINDKEDPDMDGDGIDNIDDDDIDGDGTLNGEDSEATNPDINGSTSPKLGYTGDPWEDLKEKSKDVIGILLVIAAVIAVIVIIFGGYLYISSGGDQTKATQGKNAVIGAVIGLIITFAAYAIVNLISDIL